MLRDNSYLIGNQFAKGNKPNKGSFKKSHKSWNKGKKGTHFSPVTEFKKGHKNNNHKDIGIITKRIDKNGVIRHWIKTGEPNYWQLYAVHLWEYTYGLIPKFYMIHHKNDLALDDRIENYELVTRKEHINRHRHQLIKGKLFHLKVQLKLFPESVGRKCLKGYKFDDEIRKKINDIRVKAAETGLDTGEIKEGQGALFK